MAFNYENVYAVLKAENSHIDLSGRKEQIKQLCAMCCARTAPADYVMQYERTPMEFSNGMLWTPDDCVRLVDIKSNNGAKIRYRKFGDTNAQILDYTKGVVHVDWWGLPSDANGLPPISLKQLEYCKAYCKFILMNERWEQGLVNKNVRDEAKLASDISFNNAKKKSLSRGEMEAALWMMTNGMFYKTTDVLKKNIGGWDGGKIKDRDSRHYGNHDNLGFGS